MRMMTRKKLMSKARMVFLFVVVLGGLVLVNADKSPLSPGGEAWATSLGARRGVGTSAGVGGGAGPGPGAWRWDQRRRCGGAVGPAPGAAGTSAGVGGGVVGAGAGVGQAALRRRGPAGSRQGRCRNSRGHPKRLCAVKHPRPLCSQLHSKGGTS